MRSEHALLAASSGDASNMLFMSKEEQTLEGSCSAQKKNEIMTHIFLTHKLEGI